MKYIHHALAVAVETTAFLRNWKMPEDRIAALNFLLSEEVNPHGIFADINVHISEKIEAARYMGFSDDEIRERIAPWYEKYLGKVDDEVKRCAATMESSAVSKVAGGRRAMISGSGICIVDFDEGSIKFVPGDNGKT